MTDSETIHVVCTDEDGMALKVSLMPGDFSDNSNFHSHLWGSAFWPASSPGPAACLARCASAAPQSGWGLGWSGQGLGSPEGNSQCCQRDLDPQRHAAPASPLSPLKQVQTGLIDGNCLLTKTLFNH